MSRRGDTHKSDSDEDSEYYSDDHSEEETSYPQKSSYDSEEEEESQDEDYNASPRSYREAPVPMPRTKVPDPRPRRSSSTRTSPPPLRHRGYDEGYDDHDQRHSEGETRKDKQKRTVYFEDHHPERPRGNAYPAPRPNKDYQENPQMHSDGETFKYRERGGYHEGEVRMKQPKKDRVKKERPPTERTTKRLQERHPHYPDRHLDPNDRHMYNDHRGAQKQHRRKQLSGRAEREGPAPRPLNAKERPRQYGTRHTNYEDPYYGYEHDDQYFRENVPREIGFQPRYQNPRDLTYDKRAGSYDDFSVHDYPRSGQWHGRYMGELPVFKHPYETSVTHDHNDSMYERDAMYHSDNWNMALPSSDDGDIIKQETLVNILVKERDFRATLLHLHEAFKLQIPALRNIISTNSTIFRMVGEAVELKINLKICNSHNGLNGCANRASCNDLHICRKYAESKCNNDNCIMGHNWMTNHNTKVVNGFGFGKISDDITEKLLSLSITSSSKTSIGICLNYNNKGCRKALCQNLHVCHSFVVGLAKCTRKNCKLSHDLLSNDNTTLLETAGIDINESPRDVLVALLDINPSLKKRSENKEDRTDYQFPSPINSNKDNITSSENKNKKNKPKKIRTAWSYEQKGDVNIEEICYDSVESICNNESTGCQRLHALEHYHWQVSENGSSWINLQPQQVKCLEQSYCDMDNDDCKLPRFDPSQLQMKPTALIKLLGRDIWLADFKTMTLSDSQKQKSIKLRRLSTEPGKNVKASSFIWHFLDKQQNWVEYGQIDTVGAKDLVSSATSKDIEKAYYKGAPSMTFQNSQFSYILDFKNMTQINQNTNVVREVRRRPEVHLEKEEEEEQEKNTYRRIPSEWDKMLPGERLKRVDVLQTSEEYKKIIQLLGTTIPASNVTKIERIQNRFHYTAFQNKVEEMTSIHGDIAKVDVRQLFHGTSPTVIQHICSENFDPRLHGQASGQAYGQGTYFARDVSLSHRYCKADSNGLKYMFVAQVAVGSIVIGNSSMTRPPTNPNTGAPCDSTGDNATNPSIIVKYDKAEYYPQYLVTFK